MPSRSIPPRSQGPDDAEPPPPSAPRIHAHGEREQLDFVLDFVAFVAKPSPLSLVLDEAPARIASIVGAQIASLYLIEGEGDELVLRGNVGFPLGARGTVRLSIGEGITGLAVELMRPVSVVAAPTHQNYRGFPGLPEERYPVFLAVPILGPHKPVGAIVVQREGSEAFTASDIALLVALTAPIATRIRLAHLDDRERIEKRRAGGGTRKVTLPGVPAVPGRALGAISALRRPASLPQRKPGPDDQKRLAGAFDVAGKALASLSIQAGLIEASDRAPFLSTYLLMVSDTRLKGRALELIGGGKSIAEALGIVAREAAKAANGIVGDPFMQERARDIEDLCDALVMLAQPDPRAELPSKAVLLGEDISVFDLLVTARAQPVGIALTKRGGGPRTRVLLELMGVPSILDVEGAFRWAAPGDVALLDADHGFLVINPSRAEVASVRAARRDHKPLPEADGDDDHSSMS